MLSNASSYWRLLGAASALFLAAIPFAFAGRAAGAASLGLVTSKTAPASCGTTVKVTQLAPGSSWNGNIRGWTTAPGDWSSPAFSEGSAEVLLANSRGVLAYGDNVPRSTFNKTSLQAVELQLYNAFAVYKYRWIITGSIGLEAPLTVTNRCSAP